MNLSTELISQFVKATKDTTKTNEESIVNGTTVEYEGRMYVKLDGSDLLTPVSKTTEVKDDERVTVLIKNHAATITGNITSPSARTDTVRELGDKITEAEILIADKVSTKDLEAESGRIDDLVSDNVFVKEQITANKAVIDDLVAGNVTITGKVEANEAAIKKLDVEKLNADAADIKFATIDKLNATDAYIHNLEATYGDFKQLTTDKLIAIDADIANLDANKLNANEADIKYAKVDDLEATNAHVTNLKADVADIDTLIFGSATGTTIQTSFANAVIAQLGNAQIKSAMIDNISADKINAGTLNTNNVSVVSEDGRLLISDETIQISDETRVRVQIGKDASGDYSINIWDADGKLMFSEGGITDNAIKEAIIRNDMVADNANISANKLDISSLFKEINGSTETINANRIYLDADKQTLDVSFTQMSSDINDLSNDVSTQGTSLSVIQGQISSKVWQQDIDSANNGINGSIETLTTKQSSMEQTINGINITVGEHETKIANKADSSEVEEVKNKLTSIEVDLDGISATITEHENTVNEASNKVANLEASVNGLSATVSTYDSKIASKADKSSVTSIDNKISALELDVDGFKTTVSNTYATKTEMSDVEDNVTDITERMTTAESSIEQNAKNIALRITTSDLETTLDGYSTEAETEAAIEAKANEINLSVDNKITSIDIGGRNLLRWTEDLAITDTANGSDGISRYSNSYGTLENTETGIKLTFASSVSCGISVPLVMDGCIQNGEDVTLSFDYRGNITNPGDIYLLQRTTPHVSMNLSTYGALTSSTTNWNHYEATFSNPSANVRTVYQIVLFYNLSSYTRDNWIEIKFGSLKLERGNKATDWSPAPEDMASSSDISSVNNEVLAIAQSVSSLAMTTDDITMTVKQYKADSDNALQSVGSSIESLSQSVSAMITSEDVKIEIESAMASGTSRVVTNTGFTFDDDGLTVEKSGSEMKTQITEDGMTVYQNDQSVLVANNTGVDAKNLRATTYLIVGGRSRFENYGTDRTGCFWIGG